MHKKKSNKDKTQSQEILASEDKATPDDVSIPEDSADYEPIEHEESNPLAPEGPEELEVDAKFDEGASGIIFLSSIPPYMGLSKLRTYFGNFGKIGRIYAQPESISDYKKRVKLGGNKKLKFLHGWIEFHDKKIAKQVALQLNTKPVGHKKRQNFWREDLWNIMYLPKFKWRHLVEYWSRNKRERKEKLQHLLAQEKKKNYHYIDQLEAEKQHEHIAEKRRKKGLRVDEEYVDQDRSAKKKASESSGNENVPVGLLDAIVL
ncbi:hypothetical protein BEWA_031390 [Theileria equi strain WA]|uniref:RRM domain-containing protein n=1 Tax=Theileria equi strain WA TaxID=1537102 RepID=L0AZ44_THEEQ|nr:hypothetical protein BEWA_031390 [Theileria equi strain WA]AFZ80286.1 hypothetical protein BEWA_031390 [Theileria equi strain WA]|eukprot:XP_004829952.1 hypothetical protein BEWA_031390 [Theileria equi strain WA]